MRNEARKQVGRLLLLGGVMDGGDEDLMAAEAVEDDVGSAADDEFAEIRFGGGVAEAGVELESFDEGHDTSGESLGSAGIVDSDVGANLAQACGGEGRPNNFGRLAHAGERVLIPASRLSGA